jgi:glycosyltransferase involved in cell wall biosynthesis
MLVAPSITVALPTFNNIKYIDTTILSILAQSVSDFELLIYDDCSTDGTFERASFWATLDGRIRVRRLFQENGHYIELCNAMLSDSVGTYMARIDADDLALPNRLGRQREFMETQCKAALCGSCGYNIIEDEGNRLSYDYPWEVGVIAKIASDTIPANEHMRKHHCVIHSSLFGSADALRGIGGYRSFGPLEDWELCLRADAKGLEIYVLTDVLVLRRIHGDNWAKRHPQKLAAFARINHLYELGIQRMPRTRPQHL